MIPKLHLLLLPKPLNGIFALSNFAFVTAASAIFAVVTLTSAIFAVVTLASAIFAVVVTLASAILTVVTASVAISAARIRLKSLRSLRHQFQ
jgi:hypothetical protein